MMAVDKAIGKKIAKNAAWLFGGQIVGRLLRAVIIIYSARVLGAASWGAFSYALSLAAFLTIFSDFGVNALLTREGVKSPELRNKYLATALALKAFVLVVLMALVTLLADKLTSIPAAAALLPIISLVFAFDSLRDLGVAIARSLEKMEIEAWVNIFTNLAITVFGFIFLYKFGSVASLTWGYALGSGLGLFAIIYILRDYFKGLFGNIDMSLAKSFITSAWPFGLLGLMGVVMINTDVLMLGWLTSAEATGFYSAAQKPIQLFYIIPTLIAAAFFPALTRSVNNKDSHFKSIFERGVTATYLFAVPIAIGGFLLARPIMKLLYGSVYLPGTSSFAILALTTISMFPATIIANGVYAHDKQKNLLGYVALGIFGNIFFNFLFIPTLGIAGSALSTLINQIIINIYLWRQFKKVTEFSIMPHLGKIVTAGLVMGIFTLFLRHYSVNVIANIALSGAVYLFCLWTLKEPMLHMLKRTN